MRRIKRADVQRRLNLTTTLARSAEILAAGVVKGGDDA